MARSIVSQRDRPVERYGLTELYAANDPLVDIVFVHGLNGHPKETWTTSDGCFWPRDLLPREMGFAPCRILTYGYDATVSSFVPTGIDISSNNIYSQAEALAYSLYTYRIDSGAFERPLIFVAHSFGGLLTKQCLISSCKVSTPLTKTRSICLSTYGVLFMGTPHTNPNKVKFGSALICIALAVLPKQLQNRSRDDALRALVATWELLSEIDKTYTEQLSMLKGGFFCEGKPTRLLGCRLEFLVDETRAAPNIIGVKKWVIPKEHMDMCKFSSPLDSGFREIVELLHHYAVNASKTISQRWDVDVPVLTELSRIYGEHHDDILPFELRPQHDLESDNKTQRLKEPAYRYATPSRRLQEPYTITGQTNPSCSVRETYTITGQAKKPTPVLGSRPMPDYTSWFSSPTKMTEKNRVSFDPERTLKATPTQAWPQGHASTYGEINVAGHATAVMGNVYGNIRVQNTVLLTDQGAQCFAALPSRRIERHNRFADGRTIETVTSYDLGRSGLNRGGSYQIVKQWTKCEELGAGLFGVVHREEYQVNGVLEQRAVKVLRRAQLRRFKLDYQKEIGALHRLSQPRYVHRFVEFYAWYEHNEEIYLAMEYVAHRDLERYVGINGVLGLVDTKQIGHQVLDGIRIMHKQDIVHRDIKPGNIFIVQMAPKWVVKIGDFGICKSTMTNLTTLHTTIGTTGYQAPEILGLIATDKTGHYDNKCDVWSFGCTIVKLLTGQVPFAISELATLCSSWHKEIVWDGKAIEDKDTRRLLDQLLRCSPSSRPTASQAFCLAERKWFVPEH